MVSVEALAINPVRVEGTGRTRTEAKQDAFEKAIGNVVGTAVLSQREHRQNTNVSNDITAYSAGYIDKYTVVEEFLYKGYYTLVLDVYVKPSKIANRLIGNNTSIETFDNQLHSDQISSYYNERYQGDQFVENVLSDYPYNAYNLVQYPYQIKLDAYRNTYLIVPFKLTWNYNYLVALNEMFSMTEEGHTSWRKRAISNVRVVSKNPENKIFGNTANFGFNDLVRVKLFKDKFTGDNEVRIKLEAKDRYGQLVVLRCYQANTSKSMFYNTYSGDNITINGNNVYKDFAMVKLETLPDNINDITLTVTAAKNCKNRL
jgi:hypothetical protein